MRDARVWWALDWQFLVLPTNKNSQMYIWGHTQWYIIFFSSWLPFRLAISLADATLLRLPLWEKKKKEASNTTTDFTKNKSPHLTGCSSYIYIYIYTLVSHEKESTPFTIFERWFVRYEAWRWCVECYVRERKCIASFTVPQYPRKNVHIRGLVGVWVLVRLCWANQYQERICALDTQRVYENPL